MSNMTNIVNAVKIALATFVEQIRASTFDNRQGRRIRETAACMQTKHTVCCTEFHISNAIAVYHLKLGPNNDRRFDSKLIPFGGLQPSPPSSPQLAHVCNRIQRTTFRSGFSCFDFSMFLCPRYVGIMQDSIGMSQTTAQPPRITRQRT